MSGQKPKSLQDLLKEQRKEEFREVFVGRGGELARFRDNLATPADQRRLFLFNVHGQGGVGKTFLLKRFQQLADELRVVSAWSNDSQRSIVHVMERVSEQLRAKDLPLKDFDERYRTYRQKRAELEADPELPPGFFEFLGRSVTKTGLWAGSQALGAGMLLPLLNTDELATKMGEGVAFIARKLKKDDVQLVQDPISVLTPLWLDGLREACERQAVVLFFDAYERTSEFLDEWLRDVLQGRHGETSLDLLFAVAGQSPLSWDGWRDYEPILSRMPLEPFTEEETRAYVGRKGIGDARAASDIFRKTQGLPVLVALFTSTQAGGRTPVDPHDTALDHFLKGTEPRFRQVALDAALPRRLNRDVLAALAGSESTEAFFSALKGMPFVLPRTEGWEYHPVVRRLMLACKRRESPEGWSSLHRQLGDYYERLEKKMGLGPERKLQDSVWREHMLELLYHRTCEAPRKVLMGALAGFLAALRYQQAFAQEWAEALSQGEEDAECPEPHRWGARLIAALVAIEERRFPDAISTFTAILEHEELDGASRAVALNWRGSLHERVGQLEDALRDHSGAVALFPDEDEYVLDRGRTRFRLRRYEEELADLELLVASNPRARHYRLRHCLALLMLHRYAEADADVDVCITMEPQNPMWLLLKLSVALRGENRARASEAYAQISQRGPEVFQQFRAEVLEFLSDTSGENAEQLDSLMFTSDGSSARSAREQLTALNKLVQEDPSQFFKAFQASAAAFHAFHHRQNAEGEKALHAIEQALSLNPGVPTYLLARAELLQEQGRTEDARTAFDEAVAKAPELADAFILRGSFHLSQRQLEEALADFSRAIDLAPAAGLFAVRAALYRMKGLFAEALEDLERASTLSPDDLLLVFGRIPLLAAMDDQAGVAATYSRLEQQALRFVQQLQERMADPDPAQRAVRLRDWLSDLVGLTPAGAPQVVQRMLSLLEMDAETGARALRSDAASFRAFVHRQNGEWQQALAELDQALELDPGHPPHWMERAETHQAMEQYDGALSDIDEALALQPASASLHFVRGELLLQLDRFEDALVAVERAISLQPDLVDARFLRAVLRHGMGAVSKAMEDISHVLGLSPGDLLAKSLRATLYGMQERYAEALADVDTVVAEDASVIDDWRNLRGELLARLGRYDEALEHYRQALAEEPANWRASYNLAVHRARMEGPANVGDVLADVLNQLKSVPENERADALVRQGGLEALTDNADRAFELLSEALAMNPRVIYWARGDMAWSTLRNAPRFQALLDA